MSNFTDIALSIASSVPHRVYLSVRRASDGVQVADITEDIYSSATNAEYWIERFNSEDIINSDPDWLDVKRQMNRLLSQDCDLLFVWMKEEI